MNQETHTWRYWIHRKSDGRLLASGTTTDKNHQWQVNTLGKSKTKTFTSERLIKPIEVKVDYL